jgi:hypothetical protein
MGLNVSQTGKDHEQTPEGVYPAICYRIIDLGTQMITWQGQTKPRHQVMLSWELLGEERMSDGRPFSISQTYTASLGDRAILRQHLEGIRGRKFTPEELAGFHLSKVLGSPCLLQVVHAEAKDGSGKIYANIGSLMRMPKGVPAPKGENDAVYFDLDDPDMDVYDKLPEFLRNKIALAAEWSEATSGKPVAPKAGDGGIGSMPDDMPPADNDDDIPY